MTQWLSRPGINYPKNECGQLANANRVHASVGWVAENEVTGFVSDEFILNIVGFPASNSKQTLKVTCKFIIIDLTHCLTI